MSKAPESMTLYDKLTENDAVMCVTLECSCGDRCYGTIHMSNTNLNRLECRECGCQTQQVREVFCVAGRVAVTGDYFEVQSTRYRMTKDVEET